jgi:hypothetical protein
MDENSRKAHARENLEMKITDFTDWTDRATVGAALAA